MNEQRVSIAALLLGLCVLVLASGCHSAEDVDYDAYEQPDNSRLTEDPYMRRYD